MSVINLVGRCISLSEQQEGQNFRATMARLRYLERKRQWECKPAPGESRGRMRLSVHLANTMVKQPIGIPILASVTFPLIKFKKTILLEGLLQRSFSEIVLT